MNILITGANGFIGQALCKRLLADGYQVRGSVRGAEKTEIGCLRSDVGGLRVVVGDIGPETDWSDVLEDINTVVHLAARVHVMDDSASDPLAAYRKVKKTTGSHLKY